MYNECNINTLIFCGGICMKYAIIDIGSNTIRMVVFSIVDDKPEIIGNARERSILLDCVYDRVLDRRGMVFLSELLSDMKNQCEDLNCADIRAFATASLRNVDNTDQVREYVQERTGINIRIITGDEEAQYDYAGLKYVKQTYDGVALDLGGGSCQIFRYTNGELVHKVSLPIGSLRMYHKFVVGEIPTKEEAKSLYNYIIEQILRFSVYTDLKIDTIYAMGGTAHCAIKLYQRLYNTVKSEMILVSDLKRMYQDFVDKGEESATVVLNNFADRVNSLVPGMITLCAICDVIGVDKIEQARCGVREGYMMKEIICRE